MSKLMNRKVGVAFMVAISLVMVSALLTNGVAASADDSAVNDQPAVGLVLLDQLMSGRNHVGDRVHFETVANVYDSSNNVLIPAGCEAIGRVTRSKGSGMFGKRGQLDFTCEYVELPDGDRVPLVGHRLGGAGDNNTAATAAVTVLVSPLGLLIKGGTAKYEKGTPIVMYIADGARVTPAPAPNELVADFTLSGKDTSDIRGKVMDFDGDAYTVRNDDGEQKIDVDKISSINITNPPISGT